MKIKEFTPEDVAVATGGVYHGPDGYKDKIISGVCVDNREVKPGYLFVCIKGNRVDGHSFAEKAALSGAVCCLAEHELDTSIPHVLVNSTLEALRDLAEWYRSLFSIPVVGVIGSVGKTTAKELTACALSEKYKVLKTEGNLNNEIGVPLTLFSLREEHEAAVIEMGISDFGEMRRLAKMAKPDICIMTAIGYCHLENLVDLEGVLRAKSEVFEYMGKDSLSVLNGDDDMLAKFYPDTRIIRFGTKDNSDVRAENVKSVGFEGISCDIIYEGKSFNLFVPVFGAQIIYGVLAAVSVALELGVEPDKIAEGLKSYTPVSGRADLIKTDYLTIIDDCYNANPNSVSAALSSLASAEVKGKRVAILGDMKELGKESPVFHKRIGSLAAHSFIDLLLCAGEEAIYMYEGCLECGGSARYYSDKNALISELDELIGAGDVVLVKASHSMGFSSIVESLGKLGTK